MVLEAGFRRADLRVVGMGLDVLLQILGALEGLATKTALVRSEGHMHPDMGGDTVALDSGGTASSPLASQIQVFGALVTDMALANVFLLPQAGG